MEQLELGTNGVCCVQWNGPLKTHNGIYTKREAIIGLQGYQFSLWGHYEEIVHQV